MALVVPILVGLHMFQFSSICREVIVRHWTVTSAECQRSASIASPEGALSSRLLVRRLSPAQLHSWCPTTERLAETLRRVSLEAEEAAAFALALDRVGSAHAHFSVADQRVTVGFASVRPTFVFAATADYAKGLDEVHRTVEVQWSVGRAEFRDKLESAVLELAHTSPSGFGFLEAFVEKMDLYLKEVRRRIRNEIKEEEEEEGGRGQ